MNEYTSAPGPTKTRGFGDDSDTFIVPGVSLWAHDKDTVKQVRHEPRRRERWCTRTTAFPISLCHGTPRRIEECTDHSVTTRPASCFRSQPEHEPCPATHHAASCTQVTTRPRNEDGQITATTHNGNPAWYSINSHNHRAPAVQTTTAAGTHHNVPLAQRLVVHDGDAQLDDSWLGVERGGDGVRPWLQRRQ